MKGWRKWMLLWSLLLSPVVRGETVYLTSLYWPPYSGYSLPQQGATVQVVREAFEVMGHNLEVKFMPWERAVKKASGDPQYAGYFPEYHFEAQHLLFSRSLGQGPLGLLENVDEPVFWENELDLTRYSVGVVKGYVNTPLIDAMIGQGLIRWSAVSTDLQNVLKVAHGRVDTAVIDPHVLDYLLRFEPKAAAVGPRVRMNSKLLVSKHLYVAFNNDEEGEKWRHILNQGLKKIDIEAIYMQHFREPNLPAR